MTSAYICWPSLAAKEAEKYRGFFWQVCCLSAQNYGAARKIEWKHKYWHGNQ